MLEKVKSINNDSYISAKDTGCRVAILKPGQFSQPSKCFIFFPNKRNNVKHIKNSVMIILKNYCKPCIYLSIIIFIQNSLGW